MVILDNVVCVLIKFFGYGVFFIDDEVLVEYFEYFMVLEIVYDGYLCLNGLGRCWWER